MRMRRILFVVLVMVSTLLTTGVFMPTGADAQIRDLNLPTSWGDVLEAFIRNIGEKPLSFTSPGKVLTTTLKDTLALFIPNYAMSIEQLDLNFGSIGDPDSTSYLIMQTGTNTSVYDTLLTIDSTGNGNTKSWTNTTSFNLAADSLYTIFIQNVLTSLETGFKNLILHGRIR